MNRLATIAMCAALTLLAPALTGAQEAWVLKEGQQRLTFASTAGNLAGGMLLFLPKGYDSGKWPLIVSLHARSEVGTDPEQMRHRGLPQLVDKQPDFKFIVASPQMVATATWFDPAALDAFLDVVLMRLPMIDQERIYLTGFSMGGRGAWDWATASPQRFAAVVPISNSRPDPDCALKAVPIWAFHNDRDPLVALERPQKTVDAVKACGGSVKFTVFPNREDHNAWTAAYASSELYEWLLSHKRKTAP